MMCDRRSSSLQRAFLRADGEHGEGFRYRIAGLGCGALYRVSAYFSGVACTLPTRTSAIGRRNRGFRCAARRLASGLTPIIRPERGTLLPVCPGYWCGSKTGRHGPSAKRSRAVVLLDLKVPTAERQGKAEVYICAYFPVWRSTIQAAVLVGASLFDLRSEDRFPDICFTSTTGRGDRAADPVLRT